MEYDRPATFRPYREEDVPSPPQRKEWTQKDFIKIGALLGGFGCAAYIAIGMYIMYNTPPSSTDDEPGTMIVGLIVPIMITVTAICSTIAALIGAALGGLIWLLRNWIQSRKERGNR